MDGLYVDPETGVVTVYTLQEAMVEGGAIVKEAKYADMAAYEKHLADMEAYAAGYDEAWAQRMA